jgi:hypothetical protein
MVQVLGRKSRPSCGIIGVNTGPGLRRGNFTDRGKAMETLKAIPAAVAALIPSDQLKVTNDSLAAFSDCIKNLEKSLEKCPSIGETDSLPEHPAIFHYFYGSTDIYICEYNKRNLMYGHAILGGDLKTSEWGYFFISDITRLSKINIDYHFDEMSIEAALYLKYPESFKKPFSLQEDTILAKNDPLPDVYIQKPFRYTRTKHGTILNIDKEEVFLQGEDETKFFRDCNRAKQHNRSLTDVIDEYFIG